MQQDSVHHIFAQNEREEYKVHIKENTISMDRKEHDALHVFFAEDHPREQLIKILQVNSSVIAPDIVAALQEILEISEKEFYIQEIFNTRYEGENTEKSVS